MATSRFPFRPHGAEFPAANFPQISLSNRRPVLAFDASTDQTCYWSAIAPQGLSGALTAVVYYMMASATSGNVDVDVAVEAVTPGDSTDLDAGDSFDTINSTDNTTVPGTAGYPQAISVTLTNDDSIAAGDYVRFSLTRDASEDTATGDMLVLMMEIREA